MTNRGDGTARKDIKKEVLKLFFISSLLIKNKSPNQELIRITTSNYLPEPT
jgi:hypothetical protein